MFKTKILHQNHALYIAIAAFCTKSNKLQTNHTPVSVAMKTTSIEYIPRMEIYIVCFANYWIEPT